jgi:aryl-alcohol dehydrogenase-like predicted oxidoreductase
MPVLGLGCQRIVDTANCSEREAGRILERAFERGVRYFDTAWVYGLGQSEERVGHLARERRAAMWIATKSTDRTRDGALRQLEESLTRLQTDHVDEWRLHNLETLDDVDRCFAPDGVIHAAVRAREQGLVRHVGISGHTHPRVLLDALGRFPFDSVLFPGSVLDRFVFSFEDELLPRANTAGLATIAMKTFALGKLARHASEALRYSLTLPVSMVVVGCSKLDELEENIDAVERFTPLDDAARRELLDAVRPLVTPANMPWRSPDGGKSGRWIE